MSEDGYLSPSLMGDVRDAIASSMAKNGTEEKPETLSSLPVPTTKDVFDLYKGLLSDEAVSALNNKVTQMVKVESDNTISQVRFIGKSTTEDKLNLAVKVVTEKVNELAAANLIKGALVPLITFDFASVDNKPPQIAVLSYLMLSEEGVEYFDENLSEVKIEEGSLPSSLEE